MTTNARTKTSFHQLFFRDSFFSTIEKFAYPRYI